MNELRLSVRARIVSIGPLLAATLCGGLMAACARRAPTVEAPLRPIRSLVVGERDGGRVRTFSGAARAGTESSLSFKVAGTLSSVEVSIGQEVVAGQVLARLDPHDYQLQVREAEAGTGQAEALLRNASAEYERLRALYENSNASKSQLDAARAQYESVSAQLEGASQRLAQARTQLDYTVLAAPFAGSVAAVSVEVNENVRAGQEVVLLTSGDAPEVEFAVPEVVIAQVHEGDTAEVSFSAFPGRRFAALVTEVGVTSGRTATTYPVRVRLPEVDAPIRPGMAAEATFRFGADGAGRLLLPPVAVGEDRDGRFVFVVEAAGDGEAVVHRRPVEVGQLTEDGLEVMGLRVGETVATAGVRRLSDGLRVELLEGDR